MKCSRVWAVVSLVAAAATLGACGLGPGQERPGGVELRVTRDFGRERLHVATRDRVREGDTVMRLLRSERRVETAYGDGFVQAIDGVKGGGGAGGATGSTS